MLAFLKLTRPLNLLIMVLTMAAMRYGVIGAWLDFTSAAIHSVNATPEVPLLPRSRTTGSCTSSASSTSGCWC